MNVNNRFNNYQEAMAYLMDHLPMYSQVGAVALRPGLDNITALCEYLGNPHKKIKTVHVAGSNGKGSVSHYIAATFQVAGYKTGLYTSPHLTDMRERFRINGALVDAQWLVDFLNEHYLFIESLSPSYFELNVVMAFKIFAEAKVDIAIIETGLGGRLDSTNIIQPEMSVITNISYEHTQILGDTLEKIAYEKAGIIKSNTPVVIGETHPETASVFFGKAVQEQAPIIFADSIWSMVKVKQDLYTQYFKMMTGDGSRLLAIQTDLMGVYQQHNLVTAAVSIERLQILGWHVSLEHFQKAAAAVKSLTGLRGRWDVLQTNPYVIIDVAHNPAGMSFLIENLRQIAIKGQLLVVLGCANDKNVKKVLASIPVNAHLILTQASVPRAMDLDQLIDIVKDTGRTFDAFLKVADAVAFAKSQLKATDALLITGSFFVAADALNYFESLKQA